jgi:hypothetical protein
MIQKLIKLSFINHEIFFMSLYSTDMKFAVNEIKASMRAFSFSFILLTILFLNSVCIFIFILLDNETVHILHFMRR